jgi:molybdenum cofactor synthesis domain-containing protein
MLAARHANRPWQEHPMPDLPDLIPLDIAQAHVLDGVTPLPAETVALDQAAGLVLAASVTSGLTVPTWINSAMDGFAVRGADVVTASKDDPVVLRVLGEVAAGRPPEGGVTEGTAIRIMTGAMLPDGADTVIPVEDTDAPAGASAIPDTVAVYSAVRTGDHVRHPGSDVREGAHLLDAGRACDAAAIALLAATGNAAVTVHRRPRVAVISTGDELVPPGEPLGPGQIHDCNSFTLAAQAAEAGAEVRRLGIARDTLEDLLALLNEAVAWADVVVLSGGVSVGAHDHVKAAFGSLGDLALWRVAIKPGRPFAFGRAQVGDHTVRLFGLPGNPVSVFVTFELFVRPVLRALAGHRTIFDRPVRIVRLADPMRGASGRQNINRVVLVPDPDRPDGLLATTSGGQDSYMLASLARANAMVFVPPDTDLPAGAEATAWVVRGLDA